MSHGKVAMLAPLLPQKPAKSLPCHLASPVISPHSWML